MKDYLQERREGGFTLMEMLIVVAIIAVLVAIAIPVFTAQLEKSREATDIANLRSAYAQATIGAMDASDAKGTASFKVQQQQTGWQNEHIADALPQELAGAATALKDMQNNKTATLTVTISGNTVSCSLGASE